MQAIVSGVELDNAMKAYRVGEKGAAFRSALKEVTQLLVDDDDKIMLQGAPKDVETVTNAITETNKPAPRAVRAVPKPGGHNPETEADVVKAVPARTASKQRAAARVAAEKATPVVAKPKVTQAEAKAARLARQAAENGKAKELKTPKEKKAPSPKRVKTFNAEGVETWVCHCGVEAIASQQTYNAGWRIPRTALTALCPTHSGAVAVEPKPKKEKAVKEPVVKAEGAEVLEMVSA